MQMYDTFTCSIPVVVNEIKITGHLKIQYLRFLINPELRNGTVIYTKLTTHLSRTCILCTSNRFLPQIC